MGGSTGILPVWCVACIGAALGDDLDGCRQLLFVLSDLTVSGVRGASRLTPVAPSGTIRAWR